MRIALTGAAGIGKTTLARLLASHLAIPLLEEDFKAVAMAFNQAMTPETAQATTVLRKRACLEWLHARAAQQREHTDFIEDRCAIDILSRWLGAGLSDRDNDETLHLIELTGQLLGQIDCLVVLPLVLVTTQPNEEGLHRAGSLSRLFRTQSLAIGIARQLLPSGKLIHVPGHCQTPEARMDFVLKQIATLTASA